MFPTLLLTEWGGRRAATSSPSHPSHLLTAPPLRRVFLVANFFVQENAKISSSTSKFYSFFKYLCTKVYFDNIKYSIIIFF